MKRKYLGNRSKALLAFAPIVSLGLAALLIPGGSAAISNGQFFVKAQNVEDSSIRAYAGLGSRPNATNPEAPESEDKVVASVSCGPLTAVITESMVVRSDSNQELIAAGEGSEVKPDPKGGWAHFKEAKDVLMDASIEEGYVFFDEKEQIHSTDGPALIYVKDNEECIAQNIHENSPTNNSEGVGLVRGFSDSYKTLFLSSTGGAIPRPDGLATERTYNSEHLLIGELWSDDRGFPHRDNNYAEWNTNLDGSGRSELWYKYNELHRTDGPAVIYSGIIGESDRSEYWIDGVKFEKDQKSDWIEAGGSSDAWDRNH